MQNEDRLLDYLKQTTAKLRQTRARLREVSEREREPIAIVGMGCRFPGGVRGPEELWELLTSGGDAVSGFPDDRGWDLDALFDPDPDAPHTSDVTQGGFLSGAADFDAAFFGISPREALAMDPQQRLLLETCWEAVEQAGIDPSCLHGTATGVFAGAAPSGYTTSGGDLSGSEAHLITGTAMSVLSGRVSYALGLTGPAVSVDTACSSSLVAIHLAAQALRAGECTLALAGGVTVMANPGEFVGFSQQGALAADGRCKAFGADADGMGIAEGSGMIVLERLADARRSGHRVLAVLAGSAVNQDGASNGLSAPNGPAQQRAIRAALANARLTTGDVDVVEAHGTGTTLGDPIEAQALLATYGQGHPADRPLWLGSIKSNIGHAQQAAGVAGVIKMVLALQHGLLPRTLHAEEASPHVDWSAGHVELLQEPVPWPAGGEQPRRAGVSAFGISGTNVHLILEEAPIAAALVADAEADQDGETADGASDTATVAPAAAASVLTGTVTVPWAVSGRSASGLAAQAGRLREHVLARPEAAPRDIAWSLTTTRTAFERRAVVLGAGREELTAGLAAVATAQPAANVVTGTVPPGGVGRTVFVFPGQGSQWVGMGRELAEVSPVFAARLGECAAALKPYVDWELDDVLAGHHGFEAADVVQPALWAVMVSLAAVWQAVGVQPDAVVGHSQGEIAAAAVAGILSLDDAAKVVALRSKTLTALAGRGGMMSVAEAADVVRERIAPFGERLSLAAVNGSSATVVSGEPEALRELADSCPESVRTRIIPVDYASHSAQVDDLREEILSVLDGIAPREASIPMISAMSGEVLTGPELDPAYWYASLRETVEFDRAVRSLADTGHGTFLEVSPHPVLTGAIADSLEERSPVAVGTLRREDGGHGRLLASLAEAYVQGAPVDWKAVLGTGAVVGLPTYAFQCSRYWPKFPDPVPRDLVADWRYRIIWEPLAEPANTAKPTGRWLLVTAPSSAAPAAEVARALREHGADVRVLEIDAADRTTLVGALRSHDAATTGDGPLAGVVSLLALDESGLPAHPLVSGGLDATLGLVQALSDTGLDAPLWALTRGAVAVSGEAPALAQAQVWALGRVAGLEYPKQWGGLIDLPEDFDARAASRMAAVLAEGPGGEDQVALRPSGTYVRRLVRAPRTETSPSPLTAPRYTPRGTALITGGTGLIGGRTARLLAGRGAPRTVLTSRSGPAAAGVAVLAADLAARGTAVEVVACDSAERPALAALLDRIAATGHAVSAVVHSAGLSHGAPLATLTRDELEAVFAAKVGGALHLHELTAERGLDLDAFVLFSSGAATWGSGTLAAYAAANAGLDALAESRRAAGLAATSLAWGLWGGGGMGAGEAGEQLRRYGLRLMDPERGIEALAQALDDGDELLAVADIDWSRFAPTFTLHRPSPLLAALPEAVRALSDEAGAQDADAGEAGVGVPELISRLAALPPAEREAALLAAVRAEAAAALGHADAEDVDPEQAFRDMGFDSVMAVALRNRLRETTNLRLPSTLVFDYPSVTALTSYLLGELFAAAAPSAVPAHASPAAIADQDDPIAIVGMGCRLPGGLNSPEQLWQLLADGTDAISPFPEYRGWDLRTAYGQEGGFVHEAADFDPAFFGIGPREALAMDPQQRLLLEVCWEAIERAGIDPTTLKGSRTGVFAGGWLQLYGGLLGGSGEAVQQAYTPVSDGGAVLSGRVSYTLGLEGPSLTIDTACSASLVALHLAAQALRNGECELALAGGVTVMATPGAFGFGASLALAENGRCKAFSADADGMGMGEGAAMLAVERLSDARRNGHPVLALVRGTAVNQDGASNGLTAPNGPSQQRVIRAALAAGGLGTGDVDAVEAHGTGTVLGDPIEAGALLATYGQDRPAERPLWLGSIKSNIGHAQGAAGVAGIMKMVLAMRHGVLPRTLHAEEPSPEIDWDSGAVRLLTEPQPWTRTDGAPRRAGISGFGISGTNAHVIVEEPPALTSEPESEPVPESPRGEQSAAEVSLFSPDLDVTAWTFSARGPEALAAQADRLRAFALAGPADVQLAAVARALVTTRSLFPHRAVVVGADRDSLAARLAAVAGTRPEAAAAVGAVPTGGPGKTVFVFPGQGSQWVGMGRELLVESPVFAACFARCAGALGSYVEWDPYEVLAGVVGAPVLEGAEVLQPLLWAVMVSLAAVWRAAGVVPDAVLGHSQGEIAAATVAGILSLEDGAAVVALRAQALVGLGVEGGMLSVVMPVDAVRGLLSSWNGRLSVAAVNSSVATVVSGEPAALVEFERELRARKVMRWRVPVSDFVAHSRLCEPLAEMLPVRLAGIRPRAGAVPFFSTVRGDWLDGSLLDGGYWYENVRRTVRFADAVTALAASGYRSFVEVSAHPVLLTAVEEVLTPRADLPDPVLVDTLRREDGGAARLLRSLAEAHVHGLPVDWTAALPASPPVRAAARRVELPTYAFQHRRFWPRPNGAGSAAGAAELGLDPLGHPLLGAATAPADGGALVLSGSLSTRTHPWLTDHTVHGSTLLPGAAFAEMAFAAAGRVGSPRVEDLMLLAPLPLPADAGPVRVQAVIGAPGADGSREIGLYSRPGDAGDDLPWTRNATGLLAPTDPHGPPQPLPDADFATWPPPGAEPVPVAPEAFYRATAEGGYHLGPVFAGLRAVWRRGDDVFAEVALPDEAADAAPAFGVHPALLDAAQQAGVFATGGWESGETWLSFGWTGLALHAVGAKALRVRLRQNDNGAGTGGLQLTAADLTGAPVLDIEAIVMRRAEAGDTATAAVDRAADALFAVEWTPARATGRPDRLTWAVIGTGTTGIAARATAYDTLDTLAAAVAAGAPAPDLVLADASDGAAAVLPLLQDWLTAADLEPARLVLVTRGALAAEPGEDVTDLAGAAVWGLVRSAQSENPDRFVLADLPADDTDGTDDTDGDALSALAAALAAPEPEAELAIRHGVARTRRLVRPRPLTEPERADTGTIPGTVLVTGGTGTLGAVVARHLATTGRAASLQLTSRSGPSAAGVPALAADLAARGTAVRVTSCDAADPAQLAALLERESALTGVVHAAGVLDDGVLASLTPARIEGVLRPKADAARHLDRLTRHRAPALDLFVLFSSAAAVLGAPGQGNYAAANAVLDGVAAGRRAAGLPAVSLNWGLWAEASAMTKELTGADRARFGSTGVGTLATAQGLALLDLALRRDEAQLVPVPLDLPTLRGAARAGIKLPAVLRALAPAVRKAHDAASAATASGAAGAELRARLTAAPSPAEREAILLDTVREQAAAVLGHTDRAAVLTDATFLEQGLNSLSAVELRNRIAQVTGLRLTGPLVFDHPTPTELAAHLRERFETAPVRADTAEGHASRFALSAGAPSAPLDSTGLDPLATLYLRAQGEGRGADAMHLITGLAAFRPTFTAPTDLERIPPLTTLTRRPDGPARPVLICLPSFGATADAQEFARLARGFRGQHQVLAAAAPGFAPGEPLAADPDALLDLYAATVLATAETAAPGTPFVLVGYSSGGLTAHALAARLAGRGRAPAAVVLLDTFMPETAGVPDALLADLPTAVLANNRGSQGAGGVGGDDWLTALAHYYAFDWRDHLPHATDLPTLLVRPADGPEGPNPAVDAPWGHSDDVTPVTVPGDHFSMIGDHAEATARAVESWLAAHLNNQDRNDD
ncbi:type I polyketide synthase [Streptomyces celluloflavus]|uniref:type I polyketide synthase n=1 Tax=Streptomyces celluloflavus TaxID=58344 RepID=UPI003461490A|nr:type I polyketide synthase [Streptomyces celluloflavus]